MDIIEEVDVIEKDIEDTKEKCSKIQCSPLYSALNAVIKLIIDIFKCLKPKTK